MLAAMASASRRASCSIWSGATSLMPGVASWRFSTVTVALALSVGALLPLVLTHGAVQPTLILATAAVLAAPIAARVLRRQFDPFEPIVFFVAVWGLMFVVRPLVMRDTGHTWLRDRYNIEEGITAALVLGLISAIAFVAGNEAFGRRPVVRTRHSRRGPPPMWTIVVPAVIGLGVMVALRGSTFHQVTGGVGAYVYLAPLLTIPAIVLLLRRGNTALAYGLLLVSVVGLIGLGQRAFVIWPVSSAFVYWYLARRRRPNVAIIAAVAVFGLLPLFSILEVAREQGITPFAAVSHPEARHPATAVERLVGGDTSAMFPAFALQLMTEGQRWERRPGYWIYSTTTRWIPGTLWPSKPLGSSEYLYSVYFPQLYKYNKAGTLFTLASEFYFDLGIIGVILGMGATGWLCGLLWRWATSRRDDPWTWALYAPAFGLAIVLFRGDVGLASGLSLFVFGPLLLARLVARPQSAPARSSMLRGQ